MWTGTCIWFMGMFSARFAVFVRRARVLPSPCHAVIPIRASPVNRIRQNHHRNRRKLLVYTCYIHVLTLFNRKKIFVTVPVYTLLKCVLCVCTHVLTFSYKYWLPSYPLQYEMFKDAANSSKAGNFLIIISCNGNMFS